MPDPVLTGDALSQGQIRFYDNCPPGLDVGDYLVNVSQHVAAQGTAIDECFAASQAFSVDGPRYALPPADVFSVFPPDNALGSFGQALPHVVLTVRELPWERNLFDATKGRTTWTPWLALLLVAEGELIAGAAPIVEPDPPTRTGARVLTVDELYDHPKGDGILWPDLTREWYEGDDVGTLPVSVIDLTPAAFTTLVPDPGDLRYLAHVRQVDPSAKDSEVLRIRGAGWYSVVVGNRLPRAPAAGSPAIHHVAHVVSLEGLARYAAGTALPDGTSAVRLISLKSWTFATLPQSPGSSFSDLAGKLLRDAAGTTAPTPYALPFTLPPVASPSQREASAVLEQGYVPTGYVTRGVLGAQPQGEAPFAWYRGPLSPVAVPSFARGLMAGQDQSAHWKPFGSATAALVYDKDHGLFDVSYAVAWETGRLLALADAPFARALRAWQQAGHRLIDLLMERLQQLAVLTGLDIGATDEAAESALLSSIEPFVVTDAFMSALTDGLAAGTTPPGAAAPAIPPYKDVPTPPLTPATIADLLAEPDVLPHVRDLGGEGLAELADWLAARYLLTGIPFEALAPHPALLPPESLRVAYVDPNWLDVLLAGALSIGISSTRDQLYQDLMRELVWSTTLDAVAGLRARALGIDPPKAGTDPGMPPPMTAMLVRAQVVSAFPGLSVNAYGQTQPGGRPGAVEPVLDSQIPLLRMERLADDILLCVWPGVPAAITIDEPHEGVAFGFEDDDGGARLVPRSLGVDYGMPASGAAPVTAASVVDPATGLLRIGGDQGVVAALGKSLGITGGLSVRDLAIELVQVPERVVFAVPGQSGSGS